MTIAGPETFATTTQQNGLDSPELAQAFKTVGSIFQLEPDHVSVFDTSSAAVESIPPIERFKAHQQAMSTALKVIDKHRQVIEPFVWPRSVEYVWSDGTPAESGGGTRGDRKTENGVDLVRLALRAGQTNRANGELVTLSAFDNYYPGSIFGSDERYAYIRLYDPQQTPKADPATSVRAEEFVYRISNDAQPDRLQYSTLASGGLFTRHIDDRAFSRRHSNHGEIFGPTGVIEYTPLTSPELPGVQRFLEIQRVVFGRYVHFLPENMREVMPEALQGVAEQLPQFLDMDTDKNLVPIRSWNIRNS